MKGLQGDLSTFAAISRCIVSGPFLNACEQGDLAAVKSLRFDLKDPAAKQGLHIALRKGHTAIVRLLLEANVEPSREEVPCAIQAALANSPEMLQMLAEQNIDLGQRGTAGSIERGRGARLSKCSIITNALGAAAWGRCEDVLEFLAQHSKEGGLHFLDEPAELKLSSQSQRGSSRLQDFAYAQGASPLILAVHSASRADQSSSVDQTLADAIQVLLKHGGNPDSRNELGETALHAAARFGFVLAVEALLNGGADPLQRCAQGFTPEAVASRAGRALCVQAIRRTLALENGASAGDEALSTLEQEELLEQARLLRLKEKLKEKKQRQRERQRAEQKVTDGGFLVRADAERDGNTNGHGNEELLLKENAKALQRQRHLQRRIDEEKARNSQREALLRSLQEQHAELEQAAAEQEAIAIKAEEEEKRWRQEAEAAGKRLSRKQASAVEAAEAQKKEVELLREEVAALQKAEERGSEAASYEAERHRRVESEKQCGVLESEIEKAIADLRAELPLCKLPSLFPLPDLSLANVEFYCELHSQHRKHVAEMRDLVATVSTARLRGGLDPHRKARNR